MTNVAIIPVPNAGGEITYHAVTRDRQSHGRTAGEALDAITPQLDEADAGTLIIVQHNRPDTFFDETSQQRLADLMARWRAARDSGATLPAEQQIELDALIASELHAAEKRMAALVQYLPQ